MKTLMHVGFFQAIKDIPDIKVLVSEITSIDSPDNEVMYAMDSDGVVYIIDHPSYDEAETYNFAVYSLTKEQVLSIQQGMEFIKKSTFTELVLSHNFIDGQDYEDMNHLIMTDSILSCRRICTRGDSNIWHPYNGIYLDDLLVSIEQLTNNEGVSLYDESIDLLIHNANLSIHEEIIGECIEMTAFYEKEKLSRLVECECDSMRMVL